ncbi:SGNH/GDSL hydrolase family protein [Caldimonas sp. KR1-144]|uniref:SGNH/GDSL hydrolase family protein n=1 Tax=Caldimonas sp. KR1-144 TaxID=3400911 RepID=UPI003BFE7F43
MRRKWTVILAASVLLGAAGIAKAQPAGTAGRAARWQASFEAFAELDRAQPPQRGGVLFVGSSSIRLWEGLESAFDAQPPVIKRGFGGSRLADCAAFVDRLVLPYRPRLIVVYAGDNDLAEGAAPAEVLASFKAFVESVREALPEARIAYLSIKPSPLRAALMAQVREANALIADYVRSGDNLDYIDIFSRMLDAHGLPRTELFGTDALHLNADGYALWRSVIAEHLGVPPPGVPNPGDPLARPTQSAAAH